MAIENSQVNINEETSRELGGCMRVKKIRVLIVDDDPVVLHGLQSILRARSDIEVVGEAADGVSAIARAEELRPGVILMDAQMPGMDGVEATRCVKECLPDTRVLIMAVHERYMDPALDAGADCCMMKDSGRKELVEAIRKLGDFATEPEE